MGSREQTRTQGKQMSREDKVSKVGIALEPIKETGIQGEIAGIDTSGVDEGNSGKAKVAMARAERKKAKAHEKEKIEEHRRFYS